MGVITDTIPIKARFGRLVILEETGSYNRARYVQVACDCGREINVRWQNLKHGLTTTCRQRGKGS